MTFRSGFFANTAPSYNLIISKIEPDMINAGWVKSSTNVVANQYLWNVYKSPGANNSIGADFYVMLGWDNATNANLFITMSEQWNTGNNTAFAYCPNSSPQPQGNGISNAFVSALPNVTGSNIGYIGTGSPDTPCSNTNTSFWISTTIDRIIISTANTLSNQNAGIAVYGGVYNSFMANTLDLMPIAIMNMSATSLVQPPFAANAIGLGGIFTREINQLGAATGNYYLYVGNTVSTFPTGQGTTPEMYTSKYITRMGLILGNRASWALRGVPKDIYYVNIPPIAKGDTITFDIAGVSVNAVLISAATASFGSMYPYLANV